MAKKTTKSDWWFKFEIPAWRNSPELRVCSLEARGFWIDCIAIMRDTGQPTISGTYRDFARAVGCFPDEAKRCIAELKRNNTADVTIRNGRVTLISRKYSKELKSKELNRLRVQKHRSTAECNANHTDIVNSNKKEVKRKEEEEPPTPLPISNPKLGEVFKQKSAASGTVKPEREITIWLNSIAPVVGANDCRTLPKRERWTKVCEFAIREDRSLISMLDAVKFEFERCRDNPQFFTPENCLQKLQMNGAQKSRADDLPTAEQKRADERLTLMNIIKPPTMAEEKDSENT